MNEIRIQGPFTKDKLKDLKAGDSVLLSGTIYTARDAAHKRMMESLGRKEELPFPIEDAIIYYVGPTPAPPGRVIGSAGPTTSYRMDAYAPTLLDLGQSAMIGKGPRGTEVMGNPKKRSRLFCGYRRCRRTYFRRNQRIGNHRI